MQKILFTTPTIKVIVDFWEYSDLVLMKTYSYLSRPLITKTTVHLFKLWMKSNLIIVVTLYLKIKTLQHTETLRTWLVILNPEWNKYDYRPTENVIKDSGLRVEYKSTTCFDILYRKQHITMVPLFYADKRLRPIYVLCYWHIFKCDNMHLAQNCPLSL